MTPRPPFDRERRRGHHLVGGPLGPGPREERHFVIAGIVAAVVGAMASAYAAYSQSQAQASAADFQGKIAQQQADAAAQAGKIAEENQRTQDRRVIAAQRARIGGTGAEEDVGAPLLAEMESASNAELNARRINWATQTRVQGYQAEKVGQAFAASSYRRQGYVGVGAALLTGAARAYGAYETGGKGGGGSYSYQPGSDYYSSDK